MFCGVVQRRTAADVHGVGIGACVQQQVQHNSQAVGVCGHVQRRRAWNEEEQVVRWWSQRREGLVQLIQGKAQGRGAGAEARKTGGRRERRGSGEEISKKGGANDKKPNYLYKGASVFNAMRITVLHTVCEILQSRFISVSWAGFSLYPSM